MTSGYSIASAGEKVINLANRNETNIDLEKITSHCLAATTAAPPIANMIGPNYVRQFIREDPVYSWGVAGVMIGASVKAVRTLYRSRK